MQGNITEDRFPVEVNGKWGFISGDWNLVIPAIYDDVDYFSNGTAAVSLDGMWGYITEDGQKFLDFIYDQASPFNDDQAWVYINNSYFIINKQGAVIKKYSKKEVDRILQYSSGFYLFKNKGKYGYLNVKGIVISAMFDQACSFYENAALVTLKGKSYFINLEGEEIYFSNEYKLLESFSEGLAFVSNENKYGYIDRFGKILIPFTKRVGSSFKEGMTFYFDPEIMKYGYMNKMGVKVIDAKFEAALPFNKGVAFVRNGNNPVVINVNGEIKYKLPKNCTVDVDSYLMNLSFYEIHINGEEKIVNRFSGEIRNISI